MGPAPDTIDLEGYDDVRAILKPKGSNSKDCRLERRWKRFENSGSNKQLKHNHSDSGTRSTVKSHGKVASLTIKKGHMSEDEVDEDYKFFLLTYDPHIDVVSDSDVDGSDDDINIGHNNDHNDHPYREEESLHNNPKLDKGSKQRDETGNQRNKGSDSVGKQTSGSMKAKQNLEAKRVLSKKRLHEDVSGVPKNNAQTNKELDIVDEDYQIFLNSCRDDYIPSELIEKQNLEAKRGLSKKRPHENVSGVPNNNAQTNMELDIVDEDYQIFLNSCRDDYIPSELIEKQNLEAKRGLSKKRPHENVSGVPNNNAQTNMELIVVDEDYQIFLNSCRDDYIPSESIGKQNLEAKRGLSKKRPHENVSGVPNNNAQTNMELIVVDEDYQIFLNSCRDDYIPSELIGKRSNVIQNSLVSDYVLSEVDEDYLQYLNSVLIVDGEVGCRPERNTSKTDNVDGDSNSSEPDVILLEPDQIHENTPFVSSKTYDSSWFETEKNPKDNWQLPAYGNSQFRRRLMNDLQRPYDQEECDRLLLEVRQKKQKERHRETRHGVVKFCRTRGVSESYLDLYPDLAKAIAEFKKPEKVLFLLRGFIFWLQNVTHEGKFRPWLDKHCLDFLRQMKNWNLAKFGSKSLTNIVNKVYIRTVKSILEL
ncbi:hypothetical protein AAZX31_14G139700 [Glycine max]|uniref:Uncharacterized protein n=1 Tax=Glycine max TaxID=3847 RepID=K7M718_SOYBN|nr:uncharacterized protein LOC100803519 [Glycine max]XP_014622582.1 uncharacterized protein LOC100803519 [Glycine max]KAG4963310.1 hypothetical protein JHK86_040178 [Glycine max]KAG4965787.1 hypothetical protein JHK85_040762 [Glycine max]KAG5110760.1 hypothetical protein JHK82_039983 [Glycine max]KAG5122057.1 hypothetical protein JHK84_040397 [Glycine max]KAH1213460.1 hypothetical protein GmHk_14G041423 [Glycine max]|eukprot:XP_014622581.1 uncharacterized protein LOC100803519 [Glycine max]